MPMYQIVFRDSRPSGEAEIGFFNDDGALQYARRIANGRPVEVWSGSRRVGTSAATVAEVKPEIALS